MDEKTGDWTEIGTVCTESGALMVCDPTYLRENHMPSCRNKLVEIAETCCFETDPQSTPVSQKIPYPKGGEGLGILLHPGCTGQEEYLKVYMKCEERVPGCRLGSFELKFVPF